MIITLSKNISLSLNDILYDFKRLSPVDKICFIETLVKYMHDNDGRIEIMGNYNLIQREDLDICINMLRDIINKDNPNVINQYKNVLYIDSLIDVNIWKY